ncbi:SpoIID/LytB domain protein [Bacillus capparidis]|uniref:SpoIID/LytB domain protein n=1 Tax=Bacillus capparidis TaxID=1840411 RepID=A0ABS4CV12_9BACI|nr:SpoIID/LytB domain protein [Bacillus capparidis]
MKCVKRLLLPSVVASALLLPLAAPASAGENDTISVKLKNYIGNKESLFIDINGEYKVNGMADTTRYGGDTRFDVANNVANAGWTNPANVIVVNRDAFGDALASTPLAYKLDGPILLTDANRLTPKTEEEIKKLNPDNILIIGGTISVSKNVEKTLSNYGNVNRIGGATRYEVAKNIQKSYFPSASGAVVATGMKFTDALSSASYAAMNGYPILLSGNNTIRNDYTIPSRVVISGGRLSVSSGIENTLKQKGASVERVDGRSRYEVSANLIKQLGMKADKVFLSNGQTFADALTGSVLAAKEGSSLLLIEPNSLPDPVKNLLNEQNTSKYSLLGGIISITDTVQNSLSGMLTGNGYTVESINGNLELKQHGAKIKNLGTTFTAQPVDYNKDVMSISGRRYLGNMNFAVEAGRFVRPTNENIPFEDYIKGVVPREMPAGWHVEALKAQSVAARTVAVKNKGKTIDDTTSYQVFGGYEWDSRTSGLVEETRGKVLRDQYGKPITAAFSSNNGGHTEDSSAVWGTSLPYLSAQPDPFNPNFEWNYLLDRQKIKDMFYSTLKSDIEKQLGNTKTVTIEEVTNVSTRGTTRGQRAEFVTVDVKYSAQDNLSGAVSPGNGTVTIKAGDFRSKAGSTNIKSTMFHIENKDGSFIFYGRGYGHGIGMSQYGAQARANAGQSYIDILKFYYPGANLTNY